MAKEKKKKTKKRIIEADEVEIDAEVAVNILH